MVGEECSMSPRTTDGPQEENLETSLHKQEWLVLVEGHLRATRRGYGYT